MRGQTDTRLLRDRDQFLQKPGIAAPHLLPRDGRQRLRAEVVAQRHVPDHPLRDRLVRVDGIGIEADRHRTTARKGSAGPAPDTGDREVVADAGHPGAPGIADHLLQRRHLRLLARPVEQDVRPVPHGEILDRGQFKPEARHPVL